MPGIFGDSSSEVDFLGNIYAFGAMLSFTVAHIAVIQLRRKHRDEELVFRARPNLRFRGVDWPLFAVFGGARDARRLGRRRRPASGGALDGLGWIAFGFGVYVLYRRRLGEPLAQTVRAPIVLGVSARSSTGNILVPMAPGPSSQEAIDVACRLASERRAQVVAIAVLEVPLELPLDARVPELEDEANELLDEAQAVGDSYGVRSCPASRVPAGSARRSSTRRPARLARSS